MNKKAAALLLVLQPIVGCRGPEPLSREKARGMIEASLAFQAPLDEDLKALDARFTDPDVRRELLKVEAVTSKPDGPFGMAGETATVVFSWRWNQGPLAGHPYKTAARLHGDAHGWTLYEDTLKRNLRASIAREE